MIDKAVKDCQRTPRIRIYPNTYREVETVWIQKQRGLDSLKPLFATLDVRDTENVVDSARKNNAAVPYTWSKPTLIYHDPEDQGCAEALAQVINAGSNLEAVARPLPPHLRPLPRAIEFWIPPLGSK